jgi:hypothetical protein
MKNFRVGITADFKTTAAGLLEPALAETFDQHSFITYDFVETQGKTVAPHEIAELDAMLQSLRERWAVLAQG